MEAALLALQVAFLAATRLWQPEALTDDAFIHFRNALNFARGDGLVFNPGEWVIGTTSPVYALVLGALHAALGIDLPALARGFNFLADVGIVLLVAAWLRGFGVGIVFRHAILFALSAEPLRMFFSASGMEMSLFVLAVLGVIFAADRGGWWLAGPVLGVLGWIRPEGAVAGLAVVAALALERRWRTLGLTVATAAVVAAIAGGLLLWFYGTIFPLSLRAKAGADWFVDWSDPCHLIFFMNLAKLTPLFAIPVVTAGWETPAQAALTALLAAGQVALMAVGVAWLWRRGGRYAGAALGLFALGYYLFYALTNPMIFDWYYVPHYFNALLLGGLGWWSLAEWTAARLAGRSKSAGAAAAAQDENAESQAAFRRRRRIELSAGAALVFLMWLAMANRAAETENFAAETPRERLTFRFDPPSPFDRLKLYEQAARVMDDWRGARPLEAATPEIGVFSYYYGGPVLDPYGLVSPEAHALGDPEFRARLPEPWRTMHPVNVYLVERPAMVMSAGLFLPETMPQDFTEAYEEVRREDVPLLRIFVRRDLPDEVLRAARGQ